jgi:hypothetical protein
MLVTQANQLLRPSYQLYRNAETNDTIIRTVAYALPGVVLYTHSRYRADDVLHRHASDSADTTQALLRSSTGTGGVGEALDGAVEPRR